MHPIIHALETHARSIFQTVGWSVPGCRQRRPLRCCGNRRCEAAEEIIEFEFCAVPLDSWAHAAVYLMALLEFVR